MGTHRSAADPGLHLKFYESDIDTEFLKATRLWQISQLAAWYRVPRPVRVDLDRKMIEFEYLDGLIPIVDHYLAFCTSRVPSMELLDLFENAGRSLGHIHEHLNFDVDRRWVIPPAFKAALARRGVLGALEHSSESYVYGHGDFGFSNLHAGTSVSDPLAIIDASPNGYTSGAVLSFEPFHIDLGMFASCVRGRAGSLRGILASLGTRRRLLEERFVRGYEHQRSIVVDRELLNTVVAAVLDALSFDARTKGIHRRLALRMLQIRNRSISQPGR